VGQPEPAGQLLPGRDTADLRGKLTPVAPSAVAGPDEQFLDVQQIIDLDRQSPSGDLVGS
jgi:hypothetical protein